MVGEIVGFLIGQPVQPGYAEFLTSELALEDEDPYAVPGLAAIPAEQRAGFRVVIVGAGCRACSQGIRLQQAGIPFTIVERASDVGGTGGTTPIPAAGVDSPNLTSIV